VKSNKEFNNMPTTKKEQKQKNILEEGITKLILGCAKDGQSSLKGDEDGEKYIDRQRQG
jgi:hypothetical protein